MLKSTPSGGNDKRKTKAQLIAELAEARQRTIELEGAETARQQANQALRESEERFWALIENSSDVIAQVTGEGLILYESMATMRVLGYEPAEMVGHSGFEYVHPDDAAASQEVFGKLIQQPDMPVTTEFRYKRKDGTWCWVEATGTNLLTNPSVKAIVINFHDITERKQAEERAAQLAAIVESSDDIIISKTLDGIITSWNKGAERIYGYTESEMIGKPILVLTPPDRMNEIPQILDRIKAGAHVDHYETMRQRKDGQLIHVSLTISPIVNAAGKIIAASTIGRDITERKQAEEALRASEEKFRNLFNNSEVGMFRTRLDGSEVLEFNEKYLKLLKYTREEVEGKPSQNFWADKNERAKMVSTLNAEGQVTDLEFDLVNKQGEVRRCLTSLRLYRDTGILEGSIIDITERKQAEEALRESERFAHSTVDALSAHLAILDANGEIITVNRAWREFAAANSPTPDQVCEGANYLMVCDTAHGPDSTEAAAMAAGIRAVMHGEQTVFTLEYPCHTPEEQRWFIARVTRFVGDGLVRIVVVHESITERKQAEEALRKSEERFRRYFELGLIGMAITSPTQRILEANDQICAILGYERHELLHMTWDKMSHPDDLAADIAIFDRVLAGEIDGYSIDKRWIRKDGQIIDSTISVKCVRRADGSVDYFVALLQDITARKQAEQQIENLARFPAEDPNPVLRLQPDGVILYANEASQAILQEWRCAVGEAAPPDLRAAAANAFANRSDQFMDVESVGRTWSFFITPISEGGYINLYGLDITDRKRAEEALRAKVAALQMLADIDQAIISSLDLDRVLLTLLDKVRELTEAEACSVALIEPGTGDVVFRQAVGGAAHEVIGLRLQPGEGLAGWVARYRQSVLVPDVAADARARILDNSGGFVTRDLIGVPLIAHDRVTGVIELINKRGRTFNEDDRRLLEVVAAQAVIAIENARLFEVERAGREQLESLHRIGQAINSTLDADTILDRLTDEALPATRATHGSALVVRPDRGYFERRSLRGFSPEQVEQARANWLPLDSGLNGRAYRSRQPVYVGDVQTDPDYHPLIPETRAELVVPILRGDQVIGNLDLQSPEVDAFRDVSLKFLQALTDQVAIALENARLFDETRRRMSEMSIVSQVALVGAAGRPFDETVAHAIDALSQLWPDAVPSFLFLDEASQSLQLHSAYQDSSSVSHATGRLPIDQGLAGRAVRERLPVRVGDVTADSRYHLIAPGVRSEMAAPLLADERVIGVIKVESPRLDAFSGDDLHLLTTLAGQLAIIFEKARLDAELAEHAARLEQRVHERTAELAAANARLQELDRLKSKFISDVSHELRTPITALSLNVDLLEHGKPEKREHYLQAIRQQVQRETQLIEGILNLSRLELGADKVRFGPVALNPLIAQIVDVYQPTADAKNLTLTFTPYSDLPVVSGEESQLAQVITNLVGNAINYTATGGITISAAPDKHHVIIEVRDTGLGIAPEDVPHLFERFYRGGRTRHIRGTGLGLAIAQEIVELHSGRLEVESEVAVGSTFRVYLPLSTSSNV